jgi:EmrB/QacA subfamily drug resistance transporter
LGPVLGGWLVDAWSWRLIFLVNIPIAIAAWLLAFGKVPESRDESDHDRLDWLGAALATLGLGALAYGLTEGAKSSWSDAAVLIPCVTGVGLLAVFVWAETRVRSPMMPLGLFRSPNFSGANAITLFLYFALSGALFFVPFELIRVQGHSAAYAGAALLPFPILMGLLSRWSGGLIERYGARMPLIVGPLFAAIGFALLSIAGIDAPYWTTLFPAAIVLGLGMGITVAPLTTTVMRDAGQQHAGVASGINNATARVAGLLAVSTVRMPNIATEALDRAMKESFVHSYRVAVFIAAGLALVSALCAALTIRGKQSKRD